MGIGKAKLRTTMKKLVSPKLLCGEGPSGYACPDPLPANPNSGVSLMTEERKHALLFTAALLCARKLIELDSDRPSPAKLAAVETPIEPGEVHPGARRQAVAEGIGAF